MKIKSAIVFFCLLFIGVFSAGYFLVFSGMKSSFRAEMLHKISEGTAGNVQKLFISHSDENKINWLEENEFSYNKKNFDVIKSEKTEAGTVFYVYADDKESGLFDCLDTIANSSSKNNHNNSTSSFAKILGLKYTETPVMNITAQVSIAESSEFIQLSSAYADPLKAVTTQPPIFTA